MRVYGDRRMRVKKGPSASPEALIGTREEWYSVVDGDEVNQPPGGTRARVPKCEER
jgi:hypothetical protein